MPVLVCSREWEEEEKLLGTKVDESQVRNENTIDN
jgi:hypothetical protein